MLLLMGMFAVYMGFIYNDIFSLTLPTFGTSWTVTKNFSYMEHVHPFGLDPQWHNAKNSLVFQNSMKMKMSVILGITQMLFGVCLKTSNAIYFRKPLDFFFECLPMFVFAFSLFGYMLFLIFYKWSIDWNNGVDGMTGPLVRRIFFLSALRQYFSRFDLTTSDTPHFCFVCVFLIKYRQTLIGIN